MYATASSRNDASSSVESMVLVVENDCLITNCNFNGNEHVKHLDTENLSLTIK